MPFRPPLSCCIVAQLLDYIAFYSNVQLLQESFFYVNLLYVIIHRLSQTSSALKYLESNYYKIV